MRLLLNPHVFSECSSTPLRKLQFPVEGALLEGGEEGVEFGELGAHPGLLRFHLLHDGREALLQGEGREGDF
jgi:hypothetical protein